jgi:predicted aspartyl protease
MSRALIYPVEHRDYLFYVRGSVGATDAQPKVVRLLVDTGARRTVLPKQLLREFGCKVDDPERSIRVTAAGGVLRVPIVVVPWFSCVGHRVEQFAVLGLDLPPSAEVDGLLGMDFLTKVGAVIDVEKREIRVKE